MKKRVKVDLSWRAWSLIVGFFILIGFVGLSFAYGGNSPSVMGHSAGEIEMSCRIVSNTTVSSNLVARAYCASDETVVGGGGNCQTNLDSLGCTPIASPIVGFLHSSYPENNRTWMANCFMGNYEGDVCVRAYAICCK